MPHKVVISLTQAVAALMCGLLIWGVFYVNNLKNCIVGEVSFCVVDTFVMGLMSLTAFILFAFAFVLFKAYSD